MNGIHKIGSDGGGTVALTVPSTSTNTTATLQAQDGTVALTDNIRGFKNYIINGNFDIWQRALSQTTSGYGSCDRWVNFNVGSTKTTSTQITNKTEPFKASRFIRTVVSSIAGAANGTGIQQRIEFVNTLHGKVATLSFYAKADSDKNIAVDFVQYFGSGGSPSTILEGISATKIAVTASWAKYTITVNIPSIAGKSAGSDGNDSLWVRFWLDAGSDYNSRTVSLGQQSGTFDIAQVQLEEGSIATPFEQRPYGLELSLCQRYYQSYLSGNPIQGERAFHTRYTSTGTSIFLFDNIQIPPMRATPTITLSCLNGTNDRVAGVINNGVVEPWSVYINSVSSFSIYKIVNAGVSTIVAFDATLSAEL